MSLLDQVVTFCRTVGSRLLGVRSEPVFNLKGIHDFGAFGSGKTAEGDSVGETSADQVGYGPLGFLSRPLPPSGQDFAQAACLRDDAGFAPFGWRDMRLCEAANPGGSGGTPAEGQQCIVGYGGALFTHSMAASASGSRVPNISTWYLPFQFDGSGVPTKAHAVSLDPSTNAISVVHASGMRVDLLQDTGNGPGIVLTVNGATFCRMTDGEFTVNAAKIMLKGNCYLGREAEAGAPLLGGPVSPPSGSIFISPA